MFSVSSKGMFVYKKMIHFNENISDVVGRRGRILGVVIFIFIFKL